MRESGRYHNTGRRMEFAPAWPTASRPPTRTKDSRGSKASSAKADDRRRLFLPASPQREFHSLARFDRINMPNTTPPSQPATDLPRLSAPAHRALAGAGIANLKQLSKFTEAEIKALHGIGPNGLVQLAAALAARGLAYRGEPAKKK